MSEKPDHFVGGWSDADSRPVASDAPIKHCAIYCGEACDCAWRSPAATTPATVEAVLKAGRAC